MKSSISSFIASGLVSCALALGVIASPSRALAQHHTLVTVNIPFAFHVGSKVMPAGTYTFNLQSPNILLLQSPEAHSAAFTMVLPDTNSRSASTATVVFTKYGNSYFLRRINGSNSTAAYQCIRGEQEKGLIRDLKQKPNEVAVNVEPKIPR